MSRTVTVSTEPDDILGYVDSAVIAYKAQIAKTVTLGRLIPDIISTAGYGKFLDAAINTEHVDRIIRDPKSREWKNLESTSRTILMHDCLQQWAHQDLTVALLRRARSFEAQALSEASVRISLEGDAYIGSVVRDMYEIPELNDGLDALIELAQQILVDEAPTAEESETR